MFIPKNKNTSYGVIAYKIINNTPYYCLVCRKDSFSYSEFVRGKYELEDVNSVYRVLKYMTETEKNKLMVSDFENLWDNLWILDKKKIYSGKFKREFSNSKYKFDTLKRGYITTVHIDVGIKKKHFIKLENVLKDISMNYKEVYLEPEWGFPKGKKNENENPFECAKREFQEETNVPSSYLNFVNLPPITEKFIADNLQEYTHIYYLANCPSNINLNFNSDNFFQLSEISSIGWFSIDEVLSKIRSYNIEKINVIKQIHNFLINNNSNMFNTNLNSNINDINKDFIINSSA